MRVRTVGGGAPVAAVIGGIHGDEPCGPAAVERLEQEEDMFQRAAKLILANEEAIEQDVRFIDTDLNRAFPGDAGSNLHEERLAAQLLPEIEGIPTVALHSTKSTAEPFALVDGLDAETRELAAATGVRYVVDIGPIGEGSLEARPRTLSVECGLQKSGEAEEQAYQIAQRFLTAQGALPGNPPDTEQTYLRAIERVEKKAGTTFTGTNFERVERGEPFAQTPEGHIRADEAFFPVLMSDDGYEHILGIRAEAVHPQQDEDTKSP